MPDAVELLLRAGANADVADDTGATPLYLACLNRQRALVERLLQAGANANAALVSGETVLMTCARPARSRGRAGAAGSRRERQREGARPRSDRADVGRRAGASEAVAALLEARRRRARAIARATSRR